jgi:hypothetical protein
MIRQSIVEMLFTFLSKPFYADVVFSRCKETTLAPDGDVE